MIYVYYGEDCYWRKRNALNIVIFAVHALVKWVYLHTFPFEIIVAAIAVCNNEVISCYWLCQIGILKDFKNFLFVLFFLM